MENYVFAMMLNQGPVETTVPLHTQDMATKREGFLLVLFFLFLSHQTNTCSRCVD